MPYKANYSPKAWQHALEQNRKYKKEQRANGITYPKTKEQACASAKRHRKLHPETKRRAEAKRRAILNNSIGNLLESEWQAILFKQAYRCAKCNERDFVKPLTQDHIVPLSKGGCHMAHNIQALCRPCNSSKNDEFEINEISLFDNVI